MVVSERLFIVMLLERQVMKVNKYFLMLQIILLIINVKIINSHNITS